MIKYTCKLRTKHRGTSEGVPFLVKGDEQMNIFKFARYKKILLVDCENVGFSLEIIPKNTYAFMFVSQPNKLYHFVPKNMEIINISQYKKGLVKKTNYMDFYIMYFLMNKLKKWKKKEVNIISKDKDFEGVRNILLQENFDVKCFKGTLNQYLCGKTQIIKEVTSSIETLKTKSLNDEKEKEIAGIKVPSWCLEKMRKETKNELSHWTNMKDLRTHLSNGQRKIFIYTHTDIPISQLHIDIVYDIYTRLYEVRNCGHFSYQTSSLEDAKGVYENHVKALTDMSKKYINNDIFKKAKQHVMLSYIEISSSSGKPIYNCMCEFMNEDTAHEKYFRFIEDLSI